MEDGRRCGPFTGWNGSAALAKTLRKACRGTEKDVTDRIAIRNLYKIFGNAPDRALDLLKSGETKETVLARTGQVVGLCDVSISVPVGSIYMIMGLSGSGKSTLARCINRLIEPDAGTITIDGEPVTGTSQARLREIRRTRVSMVFQHFALLPNRTVIENAEFGLKLRGVGAGERRKKALEVLDVVGLSAWANHLPKALSGGMRQRVGLARALATEADVLIMDEAFSALDPLIRSEMQDELLRLQRTLKKTILFITHDFQEALKLGSRVAIMADGMVMREGTPQDIVLDPRHPYVAAFTRDIDRARLFDAASVMEPCQPLTLAAGHEAADMAGRSGSTFVVDERHRIAGVIDSSRIGDLRRGMDVRQLLTQDYEAVRNTARLADIAGIYRPDRPIAVVDDDGQFLGRVDPVRILARIATPAAAPAQSRMTGA